MCLVAAASLLVFNAKTFFSKVPIAVAIITFFLFISKLVSRLVMVGTTPSTCTTDGTHLLPVSH
jgi:hypothetical protein